MTCLIPLRIKALYGLVFLFLFNAGLQAQEKIITGKVTDSKDGSPLVGVTVSPKGSNKGVTTGSDGSFKISVPANVTTLVVSSISYTKSEINIAGKSDLTVNLVSENASLNEVVVVGYGTARKKDLTGSVASVKAKDFNKGVITAPDQLLQGKVAGVQIINNSGAPGGATTVRIRGNASVRSGNQPLYVVDGVALDGRAARPGTSSGDVGTTPGGNPLTFLNPADISSMEVLKDAAATAIYGSRGANGVILINTKRGQSGGAPKIDFTTSLGVSNIMKRLDVLDGNEYRATLTKYGLTSGDFGGNVDALGAILRTGLTQNYSLGIGGGNENGRYRVSASYLNQEGIIIKSGLKKYTAGLNGSYKFLDSKKLNLDFNLVVAHTTEKIAPVSNNAGFTGSLVGQALQWNPTHPLRKPNDSIWIVDPALGSTTINPLAMSAAYDDQADISNVLASIIPSYKFNKYLEYKLLFSINHQVGTRKSQIARWLNLQNVENRGLASIFNSELTTQQITHTLNFTKDIGSGINLNVLGGYEYMKFKYRGNGMSGQDFANAPLPYYNYMQYTTQGSRNIFSFEDPSSELQSFFGRAILNYKDRFIFQATFRADGSSKFGKNNKYGYFPSFAGSWNVSNEDFMKGGFFNNLRLRASWGKTGNQEFPAGASQQRYAAGQQSFNRVTLENPNLKWETTTVSNIGVDFSFMDNRISGAIDYFSKTTKDLLFDRPLADPVSPVNSNTWVNLDGQIANSGLEALINFQVIRTENFTWDFGVNVAFLRNKLQNFGSQIIPTGALHGQGITGSTVQRFVNGQPVNVYYVREFTGIDKDGNATFTNDGDDFFYLGDPNPKTLLGINSGFTYKRLTFDFNMNGAFGHKLYNNTANTVLPIGNLGSRNIATALSKLNPLESLASPIKSSSRYLESGNYMKLANATLSYGLGNLGHLGKVVKGANVFVTGQNLFVLTNFSGFDPEVNTDKSIDGVPSFGIEYTPYPTARNIIFGINFSF